MTMAGRRRWLFSSLAVTTFCSIVLCCTVEAFTIGAPSSLSLSTPPRRKAALSTTRENRVITALWLKAPLKVTDGETTIYEQLAQSFVSDDFRNSSTELQKYVQLMTLFRVGLPSVATASVAGWSYPHASMYFASIINDSAAFSVIAQDSSQYIQNILTTCGLMFSILVGYTYYFLYQQQESIYLALFEEVTAAKSLLEQVALVSEGRKSMYTTILHCIDRYVKEDLTQLNVEPSILLSSRPIDDPLEDIMYLTSVGEPSIVYQTVRSLRQARAHRLGALQRKLPPIHLILLLSLGGVVLLTFPVLGAGVQTIGGPGILKVQSWYLSFIVFGMACTLGVIGELNKPAGDGAYNVVTVLHIMVHGLQEELQGRLAHKYMPSAFSPTNDTIDIHALLKESSTVIVTAEIPNNDKDLANVQTKNKAPTNVATSHPWFGKRIANRIRNRKKK